MCDGDGGRLPIVAECNGAYWDSICSLRSAYRVCAAMEESACMLMGAASGNQRKIKAHRHSARFYVFFRR